MFGDTDYDPSSSYLAVSIEEQLQALSVAVEEGKVAPLFPSFFGSLTSLFPIYSNCCT